MIPVGENGTSILFIPRTAQYNFLTWNYDDLRFRQWQPDEENSLEQLARSALTIENDTDPNKQKLSRRQRAREENEGEDKGMGKKSTSQETAAGGGGSTSVNMDE
jgi:hypothetical protein